MIDLMKRIEELAVELTRIRSVAETPGENAAGQRIYDILADLPYFRQNPHLLNKVPVQNDSLQRFSILALVRGEAGASADTVVGLAHFDTVGVSDYGSLEEFATEPYELTRRLREVRLSQEAQADLLSGDYLFGRGLFDMKTGIATLLAILERLAADPGSFQGNLLLTLVCDEEANSAGMLAAVPELVRLKEAQKLNYLALLDTDYMTALYPGDLNKYIYAGAVGKIMPSFYIVGKETHVGEAFKGLDANGLAAEIVRNINLNPLYCDQVEGEVTLPPVTLKMRDLKTEYSVQTSRTANLYFNYTTACSSPSAVLAKMKAAAMLSFENVLKTLNTFHSQYCAMAGQPYAALPFEPRVMTYRELLYAVTQEQGASFREELQEWIQDFAKTTPLDDREKTLTILEHVYNLWSDREPVIIVYITPPYYPHIHVSEAEERGGRLLQVMTDVIAKNSGKDPLLLKKFFPYISDLAYGSAPQDSQTIEDLKGNLPGFGLTYRLPLEEMQALNLPGLNIGPFGKDAHKFTERIETNFSFRIAPKLVWDTTMGLLNNHIKLTPTPLDQASTEVD